MLVLWLQYQINCCAWNSSLNLGNSFSLLGHLRPRRTPLSSQVWDNKGFEMAKDGCRIVP